MLQGNDQDMARLNSRWIRASEAYVLLKGYGVTDIYAEIISAASGDRDGVTQAKVRSKAEVLIKEPRVGAPFERKDCIIHPAFWGQSNMYQSDWTDGRFSAFVHVMDCNDQIFYERYQAVSVHFSLDDLEAEFGAVDVPVGSGSENTGRSRAKKGGRPSGKNGGPIAVITLRILARLSAPGRGRDTNRSVGKELTDEYERQGHDAPSEDNAMRDAGGILKVVRAHVKGGGAA